MPFIKEHKLVFQHLPKTAGTSVCDFFNVDTVGHQHGKYYIKKLKQMGGNWREWVAFTIVRHPVDRFVSAWQMYKELDVKNVRPGTEKFVAVKQKYEEYFRHDSVNEFVEGLREAGNPGLLQHQDAYHFWSIISFVATAKNNNQGSKIVTLDNPKEEDLDFFFPLLVLKHDRLEEDFEALSKIIGFKNNGLRRMNSNSNKSEELIANLSPLTIATLQNTYAIDFRVINKMLSQGHVSLFL